MSKKVNEKTYPLTRWSEFFRSFGDFCVDFFGFNDTKVQNIQDENYIDETDELSETQKKALKKAAKTVSDMEANFEKSYNEKSKKTRKSVNLKSSKNINEKLKEEKQQGKDFERERE